LVLSNISAASQGRLHTGNRSLCTAVVIEIKETQCETGWMGSTTLGVSKQSDTLPRKPTCGTRGYIWYHRHSHFHVSAGK